jgi:hypothetical protein
MRIEKILENLATTIARLSATTRPSPIDEDSLDIPAYLRRQVTT